MKPLMITVITMMLVGCVRNPLPERYEVGMGDDKNDVAKKLDMGAYNKTGPGTYKRRLPVTHGAFNAVEARFTRDGELNRVRLFCRGSDKKSSYEKLVADTNDRAGCPGKVVIEDDELALVHWYCLGGNVEANVYWSLEKRELRLTYYEKPPKNEL